ncbi:MAG: hypothetical protein SVV03_04835 [Candidatus Nanohaloarchaea archaeon]|nr:hypothetical protein [Candidatus Nanohaloarchaea archaeon]
MPYSPEEAGEEVKESLTESLMIDEQEDIIEDLNKALQHAESEETEYWIRTALQRLLVGAH